MTTIAYKDGVIATDSLVTLGGTVFDDDVEKTLVTDSGIFYYCGVPANIESFANEFLSGNRQGSFDWGCEAFYVDMSNDIYLVSQDENCIFYAYKINKSNHYSIGSGSDHALTAMDTGLVAMDAISYAMKRDICTGGIVKTYMVCDNETTSE
jgi:ATP-dependent protease HslVU (ClpYQ) peptidase subunit